MLGLILGALTISFAPILVKLAQVDPTVMGFYRVFGATLLLFPFAIRQKSRLELSKRQLLFLIGAGVAFALDLFVWHRSIERVGAGMATILGNTQAFYAAILGVFVFHEKLSAKFYAILLVAFIGIYLLVDPNAPQRDEDYFWGVFYGLATGLFYALYILGLKLGLKDRKDLPPTVKLTIGCGIASLVLFPMGVASGETFYPLEPLQWIWALLLVLGPQIVGWIMIVKNLPTQKLSVSGLILLLQPALATLWGVLIFNEEINTQQIVGAVITLGAVYVGSTLKVQK